jgi:hypothetical protein
MEHFAVGEGKGKEEGFRIISNLFHWGLDWCWCKEEFLLVGVVGGI